ncbi:MAG TPA: hypothetical protein VK658_24595 [Chryseolinea sp.]|nr:hypothetical protein [Chryseolinea sp.]
MVESTDPFNGLVTSASDAGKRLNEYLMDKQKRAKVKGTFAPPFNTDTVYDEISLKELSGLHYYNIGVNHINKNNSLEGLRALKKAAILYPDSRRIQHLQRSAFDKYEAEQSVALN